MKLSNENEFRKNYFVKTSTNETQFSIEILNLIKCILL